MNQYKIKYLAIILFCAFTFCCATSHIYAKKKSYTPMMGWSSWNSFRININDSLICSVADSMVAKGLLAAGYNYVNIDDGFFGGRDQDGTLFWSPRFPRGLAPIAKHIHNLGMKAGIYSDAGDDLCSVVWDNYPQGRGVGLWQHEKADLELFIDEFEFDFIKVDFCGGLNIKKTDEELYTNIYQQLQKCKRKDIRFNICRWQFPGTWAINMADSWRIDGDITPNYKKIDEIILKNLYLGAYASPGHYNDMDMLEMGRGLSVDEEKTHLGMWCIMSSPLMIGCDVRKISPSTLHLLLNKEAIALNQDPLGLQAQVIKHTDSIIVVAKDIKKLHSTTRAVAVYNRSEKAQKVFCPFKDLLLDGKVAVRDIWEHREIPTTENGFYVTVPSHGCGLFTLKGKKRIDATIYEAENAYLNAYSPDSLTKARVHVHESASNNRIVKNLGGDKDNWCRFSPIHVSKSGDYILRIYGFNQDHGNLNVAINGLKEDVRIEEQHQYNAFAKDVKVRLKKGDNQIIISSPDKKAPDLDKIEIALSR